MLIYMIVCTGVPPWIVLGLLQYKTRCLFTYIRSGSVSHYFPVGSQKLFFSRTGFVCVNNWKNSENSSTSQLRFLLIIYLRFIITLVKGMFDLQIDKKKKQKTTKKTTAHSQNILPVDVLYNIKRKKYIYNIRTLSVNKKIICTSFRKRQNSEPSARFSCLFRSEYKWILYLRQCTYIVFILQCKKSRKTCQI